MLSIVAPKQITAYLSLVLVWSDIMAAIRNSQVSRRLKLTVALAVLGLAVIIFPLSVVIGITSDDHVTSILRGLANTLIAVYVLALELAGGVFLWRSRRVLRDLYKQTLLPHADRMRPVYTMALKTCIALFVSISLGLLLVVAVSVAWALKIDSSTRPVEYIYFLFIVYVGVEGGASLTLLAATWQSSRKSSRRTGASPSSRWHLVSEQDTDRTDHDRDDLLHTETTDLASESRRSAPGWNSVRYNLDVNTAPEAYGLAQSQRRSAAGFARHSRPRRIFSALRSAFGSPPPRRQLALADRSGSGEASYTSDSNMTALLQSLAQSSSSGAPSGVLAHAAPDSSLSDADDIDHRLLDREDHTAPRIQNFSYSDGSYLGSIYGPGGGG